MAIGALLNAVYDAGGALDGGRVLFLLDEVARLGYMNIMEVARDAGRKYGITLMLAASLEAYRPGGLVVVRAALRDPNRLSAIPADGVGGFVYIGGPIPLNDIDTRGVRYTGRVGVEVQGWLRAKEAGRYQLAMDVSAHRPTRGRPASCNPGWKTAALISAPPLLAFLRPTSTMRLPPSSWVPSSNLASIVCALGPSALGSKVSSPPSSCSRRLPS